MYKRMPITLDEAVCEGQYRAYGKCRVPMSQASLDIFSTLKIFAGDFKFVL